MTWGICILIAVAGFWYGLNLLRQAMAENIQFHMIKARIRLTNEALKDPSLINNKGYKQTQDLLLVYAEHLHEISVWSMIFSAFAARAMYGPGWVDRFADEPIRDSRVQKFDRQFKLLLGAHLFVQNTALMLLFALFLVVFAQSFKGALKLFKAQIGDQAVTLRPAFA